MLGISTCWWVDRIDRGDEFISDILKLGLEGIELEYRIKDSFYRQIRPQLKKTLKVLSIHNFFPKPEELEMTKASGDLFLLSSTDQDERLRAVKYSVRTIEHAYDLGAKAVILHLGRVEMSNPTPKFLKFNRGDKEERKEALFSINEQRLVRGARHQKNLDAVLFSLEDLNREAERRGISLGIENRYHFHEIPDFEEIGLILGRFQGGHVRYWHDVGHALAQENMGIIPQRHLLEAYSKMMIGIHLHDVIGCDDHLAPGQGELNFKEIKPFLNSSHIKILEVHSKVDRKDLLEGIRFIKSVGIE
ncbi:MAG: TIM barrel protein [Desulfatiglandales bacterium]